MDRYDPYTDKFIKAQPHTYRGVTLNDVMMYFDSLEGNEDAWTEFCSCLECRGWGLYHIRSATDKNVGTTDTISRQAAIDALNEVVKDHSITDFDAIASILDLPPAQPEPHLNEWCTDCKEYDKERHCCPRWNKVIRQALADAQPEPCEDAVSRTEILRMINCINDHHAITPYKSVGAITEHLTRIASSLPPVAPKQPDCAKCKSELANKIRGQQDNPGMLTENDKGRNWGLEWAAQIVEGKRR